MKKIILSFFVLLQLTLTAQVVCSFNIRDTSSCSVAPLLLRVPISYSNVLWDDGDTTATNTFTSSGLHWVTVTVIDTTTVNLVTNGDFESGRTSFTSGYSVGVPGSSSWGLLGLPGTYEVLSSPTAGHINFFGCTDVTSAPGTQMLVANGASSATDVWCQTVAVSPNTNYIFSAWATNVLNDANVAQLQFKINGSVIGLPFATTAIGCQWRKFFAIWNSGPSVTANICIRNLNTSGGGNDFAIDEIRFSNICVYRDSFVYTVNSPSSATIRDTTCNNQPYLFNGNSITVAGLYQDTLVNYKGCDSFLTLNLTVFPVSSYTYNQTICSNQSYTFNGVSLNSTGTYLDTLINAQGCDSFLTMNLLVNSTSAGSYDITICANQNYSFNGTILNTTGSYLDTLSNYLSCDSVVTLNLTVNATSTGAINQTICSNYFYLFNGVNLNTSGIYLDTFTNYLACDSVVTLVLTVNRTSSSAKDTVICFGESYLFNGINLNTSGTYLDTVPNYLGCDSFLTLRLTCMPYLSATINAAICSNGIYFFNGIFHNTAGTYKDTLISINGCDSFITLNLTVLFTSSANIYDTLCQNQTLTFNGLTLDSTGLYNDTLVNYLGCDSFQYLYLTVNPNPKVQINAGNDTIIFEGQSVFLRSFGAVNYLWNTGMISSFLTATPTETANYYVIGTDSNNCNGSDTILVIITEKSDSVRIAVPSAFTPNGDGMNDLFRILATYNFSVQRMTIFNRWGELVFSSDELNQSWDGNFRGREQPIGTYVYSIEGKSKSSINTKIFTGVLTLIR